jgi:hypothetical protein
MCVEKSSSWWNIFSLAEVNSAYPLMKIPFNKIEQLFFSVRANYFPWLKKIRFQDGGIPLLCSMIFLKSFNLGVGRILFF